MARPDTPAHGSSIWDTWLLDVLDDLYGGPAGTPAPNATYVPKLAEQSISAKPTSAGTNDRTLILGAPADFSQVFDAQRLTLSGADTLGTPATGYDYAYETIPKFLIFDTGNAGHNQSTSTNDGRTAGVASRIMAYNGGAGDLVAYNAYVEIYTPTNAGLTHWLADAAGSIINGDVGVTNGDHHYLNPLEFNLSDGGHDTAAIGTIINLNRTNAAASRGEVWIGHRVQGSATVAADVGYSIGAIPLKRGIDLSQPTYDADKAAVTLAQDQRIYFKATTAAINGVNWYATTPGTAWIDYNSTKAGIELVAASGIGLLVTAAGSAVNYLRTQGQATGIGAVLSAEGSDATVSMLLCVKGSGSGFNFQSNGIGGPTQFYINGQSGTTNYLQVTAAGTGGSPELSAQGGDADVDLLLTPKGTGRVRFGTFTANADAPITGYVTVKDAAGNTRKLATIA